MIKSLARFFLILAGWVSLAGIQEMPFNPDVPALRFRPEVPELKYSILRTGPLEVAKVFGRAQGCQDMEPELIEQISTTAVRRGTDPRIVAATIAVESGCNPYAVSSRGAIGMMQVVPRVWKSEYNFEDVNLFNRRENIETGTEILSNLIEQYGVYEGIRRYQGTGEGCPTCDAGYVPKILNLAGRK